MNTAFAVGEMLDVRIHKNDIAGDIWTNEEEKIQVSATREDGSGVGLGKDSVGLGLDATKGGLKFKEKKTCSFEISDGAGGTTQKNFEYEIYEQLASGNFLVPAERIETERFIIEGVSPDPIQCPTGSPVSDTDYQNFLDRWQDVRRENPFLNYPDTLRLFPNGGNIKIKIETNGDNIKIFKKNLSGIYTDTTLSSFSCKEGDISGVCEKSTFLNAGEKRAIDLVIVPKENGIISRPQQDPPTPGDDGQFSESVTILGNFLVRTNTLLDWALQISESGLENNQIADIFQIFLNVANGFFLLILLIIALLWNFSAILPRDALRKMIALFAIATISVNLALPLTRLAVDGTNILQKSFLTRKTDSAIEAERKIAAGIPITDTIAQQLQEKTNITANDILSAYGLDYGGFVGIQKSAYEEKGFPQNLGATVDPEKLSGLEDKYIDRMKERTLVNLVLVGITAFAQLTIACIFLFRNILLWFLLIFSPFLFVLFLFSTTRWMFRYWIYLYSRWILIGPLLAMCLFITVNIWTSAGIPIESGYAPPASLIFPNTTNLYLSAPGITSGYLNTPRELMKYIAALMMLFISIVLPFWLTRVLPGGSHHQTNPLSLGKKWGNRKMTDFLFIKQDAPKADPPIIGADIRNMANRSEVTTPLAPEIKSEFQEGSPLEMIKNFGKIGVSPEERLSTNNIEKKSSQDESRRYSEEISQKASAEEKSSQDESRRYSEEISQAKEDVNIFTEKQKSGGNREFLLEKEKKDQAEETIFEPSKIKFPDQGTPEEKERTLEKERKSSEDVSRMESRFGISQKHESNNSILREKENHSREKIESKKDFHEKKEIIREKMVHENKDEILNKGELNKVLSKSKKPMEQEKERETKSQKDISKMTTRDVTRRLEEVRKEKGPIAAMEQEKIEKELKNRAENGDREAEKAVQQYWEKTAEKSDLARSVHLESSKEENGISTSDREKTDLEKILEKPSDSYFVNIPKTTGNDREIMEKTSKGEEEKRVNMMENTSERTKDSSSQENTYFVNVPKTTGNDREIMEKTSGKEEREDLTHRENEKEDRNNLENAEISIAHAEILVEEKNKEKEIPTLDEPEEDFHESEKKRSEALEWAEEEILEKDREEIFNKMFQEEEIQEVREENGTEKSGEEDSEKDILEGDSAGDFFADEDDITETKNGNEWDIFRKNHEKLEDEISEEEDKKKSEEGGENLS